MNVNHARFAKTRFAKNQGKTSLLVILALVALAAIIGFLVFGSGDDSKGALNTATYLAEKTNLVISVKEGGTLQSADPFEVKSEIEGSATILDLAREGVFVDEGDLLVELDASTLFDDRNRQEINFANAEASKLQAEKAVDIQISLNQSNISQAELAVELAQQDLKKYLEADFLQEKKTLSAEITLAQAELERAREQLDGSIELAKQGYISDLERKADELTVERRKLDVELAVQRERILLDYEYDRQLKILRSNLEQAQMELERVGSEAVADLANRKADLAARTATFDLEARRLERIRDQISKAKVFAPQGGLVVFATISQGRRGGDDRPIEVGASIRERQLILSVTNSDRMLVDAKIHESSLNKVREGQKVNVTVDAVPGIKYEGAVERVARMPDSQNMWLNPDLKVYSTRITLDTSAVGGGELRPGMSCTAEIICSAMKDVIAVPLQAVFPKGGNYYAYLAGQAGVELRQIEVGLHNDRMVHVTAGLQEGDLVYLAKPPGAPDPEIPESEEDDAMEEAFELAAEGNASSPEMGGSERTSARGPVGDRTSDGERSEGRRGNRGGGGRGLGDGEGGGGFGMMSDEDRQKFRERFENMSEEEKAEFAKRFGQGRRGRDEEGSGQGG